MTRGQPARGYSWPPFQPGHTLTLKHGAESPRTIRPIADALAASLTDTAPWTTAPAHQPAVAAWAYAEAQCHLLRTWLDEHGLVDDDGEVRAAAKFLERTERRAVRLRDELGLGPLALAKLLAALSAIDPAGAADGLDALKAAGREIRQAGSLAAGAAGELDPAGELTPELGHEHPAAVLDEREAGS